MKKKFLIICLLFSVIVSTIYADESKFWTLNRDNSFLRSRIDKLNNEYFNGKLNVTYIDYKDNLLSETNSFVKSYFWNSPYKQIIVVDSQYFNDKFVFVDDKFFVTYPGELDGALLHEMCHVYANMHDADAEISGIDGHQLPSYKMMMKHLIEIGANPRTGEGIVNIE